MTLGNRNYTRFFFRLESYVFLSSSAHTFSSPIKICLNETNSKQFTDPFITYPWTQVTLTQTPCHCNEPDGINQDLQWWSGKHYMSPLTQDCQKIFFPSPVIICCVSRQWKTPSRLLTGGKGKGKKKKKLKKAIWKGSIEYVWFYASAVRLIMEWAHTFVCLLLLYYCFVCFATWELVNWLWEFSPHSLCFDSDYKWL